jgi:aldehyde oxidoreductase
LFNINGIDRWLVVSPEITLAEVLRNNLMMTGCKVCCNEGHCGSCTVIVDGKANKACITPMEKVAERASIVTIEGIGIAGHLHPLQTAWMAHGGAQCGICTPGFIMSAKVLLDGNNKPTRDEVRNWFNKNRNLCRCTGYKPLINAVMDAARIMRGEIKAEDILNAPIYNTDDPKTLVGGNCIRPSALAKVTGTWDFGADVALHMPEGTLRLALTQAEVSHANIKSIDTSEAEKMPGVVKVITWKDVKGKNAITGLITFPTNKGDGWDRPILCHEKVFQFGDAIAIVAADTEEHAKAAAKKVKVDLEVLPAYMSGYEALAPDAMEIHPGVPNAYYEQGVAKGEETKPLLEKAAHVIELTTYNSRQPHLHLEPDCGEAFIEEDGTLTILSKSIGLHLHHAMICPGIGVAPEKLRIMQNPTGGTFGYKFSPTMEGLLGVACLACDGRPVSLVYDQYQNITYTGKRSPAEIHAKWGFDKDGKIIALEYDWWLDHGPYSEFGDLVTVRQAQFMGAGYDVRNIRAKGFTVATNHGWGSAFRGYGSPQAFLNGEIAMDMAAEKLGIDPLELRLRNCYKEGTGCTTPTGQVPEVFVMDKLLKKIQPAWEEAKKRKAAYNVPGKAYGIGLSLGIYGSGLDGPDASEAAAELLPNGDVRIYDAWQDHGQGSDLGSLTFAHEALRPMGIKPSQIQLDLNDTRNPNSGPSGGSRSNVFTGNAIVVACRMLVDAMKKPDGSFRTYAEMKAENLPLRYDGKWVAAAQSACSESTAQGNPFPIYMYGTFVAEVEVDLKSYKTKCVAITSCMDVGTIINRITVDGQNYGGITQAMGLGLTEDFDDLKVHTTLAKCGIPYPNDVPDHFEMSYIESPRPLGLLGQAGTGEVSLTSLHPACLNAIYSACGARVFRVPAIPERIKAALDKKGGAPQVEPLPDPA